MLINLTRSLRPPKKDSRGHPTSTPSKIVSFWIPLPPFPQNFRCPPFVGAGKGMDIFWNSTLFRISQKPHSTIVKYLLPSRWIPVLALIYILPLRSVCLFTLQWRAVDTFPVYIEGFTFKIVAAHLCGVTEIAPKSPFYKCEQKPYPTLHGFACRLKSYQLRCDHSLIIITGLMYIWSLNRITTCLKRTAPLDLGSSNKTTKKTMCCIILASN